MPSNVTIEPITIERFEGYHQTLDLVASEAKYLGSTSAPPVERSLAFVRNNIHRGNPHLVVIDNGKVVGWCDICRDNGKNRGELGMGLLPEYREQGIGLTLVMEALNVAQNAGITEVVLTVHTDNVRAIALYNKVGFTKQASSTQTTFLDGAPKEAIKMLRVC